MEKIYQCDLCKNIYPQSEWIDEHGQWECPHCENENGHSEVQPTFENMLNKIRVESGCYIQYRFEKYCLLFISISKSRISKYFNYYVFSPMTFEQIATDIWNHKGEKSVC